MQQINKEQELMDLIDEIYPVIYSDEEIYNLMVTLYVKRKRPDLFDEFNVLSYIKGKWEEGQEAHKNHLEEVLHGE